MQTHLDATEKITSSIYVVGKMHHRIPPQNTLPMRPLDIEQCYPQPSILAEYHNLKYNRVSMTVLLRIPAIHGAKTTKNQTPLARLAQ